MESYNLRSDVIFDVQCDNMHCYTSLADIPLGLGKWIDDLLTTKRPDSRNRLKVSLDMIWDEYGDDGNLKTPVTLQLCHENRCIIYHVYPPDNFPSSALQHLLNHTHVDFVGFGLIEKVNYLRQTYNLEVIMENWYDIPSMPIVLNSRRFARSFVSPLQDMVFIEFSKWYPKPIDLLRSNWRLMPLSPDKITYAALDCYFAYKLSARLSIPHTIVSRL